MSQLIIYASAAAYGDIDGQATSTVLATALANSRATSSASNAAQLVPLRSLSKVGADLTGIARRGFLRFDTSVIPAGTVINSMVLRMVASAVNSGITSVVNSYLQITKYDWAAAVGTSREANFDGALAAAIASRKIWKHSSAVTINTQYESEALPTSWVNPSGNTNLALVFALDWQDASIADPGSGNSAGVSITLREPDEAAPSYRPALILQVTYPPSEPNRAQLQVDEFSFTALAVESSIDFMDAGPVIRNSDLTTPDDMPTLEAGVWTPTLTNGTNVAASTAAQCVYQRVGNVVAFAGRYNVDPTATGAYVLGISLPIASDFTSIDDASGVVAAALALEAGGISSVIANDRLQVNGDAVSAANHAVRFSGTYIIL